MAASQTASAAFQLIEQLQSPADSLCNQLLKDDPEFQALLAELTALCHEDKRFHDGLQTAFPVLSDAGLDGVDELIDCLNNLAANSQKPTITDTEFWTHHLRQVYDRTVDERPEMKGCLELVIFATMQATLEAIGHAVSGKKCRPAVKSDDEIERQLLEWQGQIDEYQQENGVSQNDAIKALGIKRSTFFDHQKKVYGS